MLSGDNSPANGDLLELTGQRGRGACRDIGRTGLLTGSVRSVRGTCVLVRMALEKLGVLIPHILPNMLSHARDSPVMYVRLKVHFYCFSVNLVDTFSRHQVTTSFVLVIVFMDEGRQGSLANQPERPQLSLIKCVSCLR